MLGPQGFIVRVENLACQFVTVLQGKTESTGSDR